MKPISLSNMQSNDESCGTSLSSKSSLISEFTPTKSLSISPSESESRPTCLQILQFYEEEELDESERSLLTRQQLESLHKLITPAKSLPESPLQSASKTP